MSPDAGTNVVDVYVNYLRKKLSAGQPAAVSAARGETEADRLIETVRGEGYAMGTASSALAGVRKPVASVALDEPAIAVFGSPIHRGGDFGREALASA
jgi:hypothetical protein